MEFGEFFVVAVKVAFIVIVLYYTLPLIYEMFPNISRFGWLIITAMIAVIVTFVFGYLARGDTSY